MAKATECVEAAHRCVRTGMLFCSPPTMKRHLGVLIALAVADLLLRAPGARTGSGRDPLPSPRRRSRDAGPDDLDRGERAAGRGAALPAPARDRRRPQALAGPGAKLERLSRRPDLRAPPRSRRELGRRLAGDLRRRPLHDRADPRPQGAGDDVALGLRGSGRDRDPGRGDGSSPLPGAVLGAPARAQRPDRLRGGVPRRRRHRSTRTASPSATDRTASRPGRRTRRFVSCAARMRREPAPRSPRSCSA